MRKTACLLVLAGLVVCVIAGFRPQSFAAVPLALMFMALTAIVFAALGTAIGAAGASHVATFSGSLARRKAPHSQCGQVRRSVGGG